MNVQQKKSFIIGVVYAVLVVGLIFAVYKFLIIYLLPFIIGLALSFFLQKPSLYISQKTGLKKGTVCAVLVILSFLAVILCLAGLVLLLVYNTDRIIEFIKNIVLTVSDMTGIFTDKMASKDDTGAVINRFFSGIIEAVSSFATQWISSAAGSIMAKLPALFFSIIITIVASFYIAKDYKSVREYIVSLIPENKRRIFFAVKRILTVNVFKMFKGYFILSVITFAELFIAFLIIGVDGALLKAVLISLVDALPVLGTGIVLMPWAIIELLSSNYIMGISLLIIYLIVLITRNFAEPKIVGKQIGIPPLVSLLLLFIGLKLFGFIGMIFSVLSLIVIINLYKEKIIDL